MPSKKAFVAYDPSPTKEAQEAFQVLTSTHFRNITFFYINVPKTDAASLRILGIPSYEAPAIEVNCDVVDAVLMNGTISHNFGDLNNSCLSTNSEYLCRDSRHESNSEDSSLSEGDRTLVESLHNRGGGDSHISSGSHSPQLSSPEDEHSHESYSRIQAYFNGPVQHIENESSWSGTVCHYFHAIKIEAIDNGALYNYQNVTCQNTETTEDAAYKPSTAYKVLVDARMKMTVFKKHIESLIKVPCNYFKIQRKLDSINSSQSLVFLSEGETLSVELGRILQADEYRAKVSFLRLSDLTDEIAKVPFAFEWIYNNTMTVAEAKKELVAKFHRIDQKYHTLTLNNCRIWLKGGRNPVKILSEDEILGHESHTTIATEYMVQECEDGIEVQPNPDSVTLFVRRWYAEHLTLGPFQEITLEKENEIRSTLAALSDIPEEVIAYSKVNSTFPCTTISLLSINTSMSWYSIASCTERYPITTSISGTVYFYKDLSKLPKDLTPEERRAFTTAEKARLDRLGCNAQGAYSNRRERALKIYLDSPQNNQQSTSKSIISDLDYRGDCKKET